MTTPSSSSSGRRGYDHEQRYIEQLTSDGRTVVEMQRRDPRTPDELRASEAETLAAMRNGVDVIFQGTFFDGRWRGHPDFLVRRDDRASDLGAWSYDVADTKLAKRVKAAAILQMCVYADLLARLQGIPPETISVVTGDRESHVHRLDDYAAYYRSAKRRFEERVFAAGPSDAPVAPRTDTYPEPVDHCRVCSWWQVCMDRRRADDHLSIVAGAAKTQRRQLVEAGVPTLAALGRLPAERQVRHMQPRILERLRRQAALQLEKRTDGIDRYELIPPNPGDPGKGLAALPPPSRLDVFFDIEADPWAFDDGLEYLFGWTEAAPDGSMPYHAIWAHDRAQEKAMLEAFVDMVMARLADDPGMHVYHYGGYESGALKRLMQRHATREDEIDRLLRGRVLVNLYDHVVRPGVRASLESYSIKKLETFYMPHREGGITQAGFSVVEYERWMETADPAILDAIAAYNRDDCVSNLLLRDWLEARRVEALEAHPEWYPDGEVPRPDAADGDPSEQVRADQAETAERESALRDGVPVDRADRTPEQQGRWLLAALLDWHRREAKPQWWLWYELDGAPAEDLVANAEALGDLEFREEVARSAKSVVDRYGYDPAQETKLHEGDKPLDPATKRGAGEIVGLDPLAGTVDLKHQAGTPHPRALIPSKPYGPEPMRGALGRLADHVIAEGIEGTGRFRAARDLILRELPRVEGVAAGTPLASVDEDQTAVARRLGLRPPLDRARAPGPAGDGQDIYGGPHDPRPRRGGAPDRRHGAVAPGHRQPPRGHPRGRRRGGSLDPARPTRRRGRRGAAERHRAHPVARRGPRRARGTDLGRRRGHLVAVGARGHGGRRRRVVRRRGGAAVAGHRLLRCRSGRFGRAAGRPEPAPAGVAGHPSRWRGGIGARASRGRGEDDRARAGPPARDDLPAPPRRQRLRLGRVLRESPRRRTRQRAPGRGRRRTGGRHRDQAHRHRAHGRQQPVEDRGGLDCAARSMASVAATGPTARAPNGR